MGIAGSGEGHITERKNHTPMGVAMEIKHIVSDNEGRPAAAGFEDFNFRPQ